jgi:hypothetical protein
LFFAKARVELCGVARTGTLTVHSAVGAHDLILLPANEGEAGTQRLAAEKLTHVKNGFR